MARLPSRRVATKLNHSQGDHRACAHSRLKYDATESNNSNNAIKLGKKKENYQHFQTDQDAVHVAFDRHEMSSLDPLCP